ncbi:MAG: deoxyribonuclease V [Acidobacteria bacterium]|nr:MAG: deoxyribonuclease V [Acidobacteriota bacterium]
MKAVLRTRWDLAPRAAMRLQERLRERVILEDRHGEIRFVAGADLAFEPETNEAVAGVIVFSFPEMKEVERRHAWRKLRFPYVPGLLSFRETPVLMAAFRKLRTEPDLILIDGHGLAHPRRFGIACHVGVIFDKPTIGCAKSLLVGEHRALGLKKGSTAPLMHHGERVGVALRTRDGVKPIYVTQGHRVSLARAVRIVGQSLDGFRIPKPTREADHYVRELRRRDTDVIIQRPLSVWEGRKL